MKTGDLIELKIDDLDINGSGIGKPDGFCLFVPGALPGETVRARASRLNKSYGFAVLEEITSPSPQRCAPACRYYKQCGGCTLQHLSYAAQLEWKTAHVQGCLARIGGIEMTVSFTLPSPREYRCRNKAAFPIVRSADGRLSVGLYSARSHVLTDVDDCVIQNREIALLISQLKAWIEHNDVSVYNEQTGDGLLRHAVVRTVKNGDMMLTLCINGDTLPYTKDLYARFGYVLPRLKSVFLSVNKKKDNTILGDRIIPVWGTETLTESILGLDFNVGPLTFLQVNGAATDMLYSTLFEFLQLTKDDAVADLYCGAGTITLPAAQRAKCAFGIEIVPQAVKDARENARINGIENAEFLCGDIQKDPARLISAAGKPDALILDPPRRGLSPLVIRACAQTGAARIGYVSCNPATLARDLAQFAALGYETRAVQPVDMFPQTTHVETVVLMSRMYRADQMFFSKSGVEKAGGFLSEKVKA